MIKIVHLYVGEPGGVFAEIESPPATRSRGQQRTELVQLRLLNAPRLAAGRATATTVGLAGDAGWDFYYA